MRHRAASLAAAAPTAAASAIYATWVQRLAQAVTVLAPICSVGRAGSSLSKAEPSLAEVWPIARHSAGAPFGAAADPGQVEVLHGEAIRAELEVAPHGLEIGLADRRADGVLVAHLAVHGLDDGVQ